ncbi:MAG: EF-hand domain-containing protein [Hyphomicrobiales bacterium]
MHKRTKILLAIATAGNIGTVGIAGVAMADRGGWGKNYRGHHGMGMGSMGDHHSMGRGGKHMVKHFRERYDANKDGKISQEEINTNRTERHKKYDANGDGKLSLEEFEGLWMEAYRKMMVRSFQFFDTDGDAQVTLEEYQAPLATVVEDRDRNGDGVLSKEDRKRHGKHHRKWRRDRGGDGEEKKSGDDN